MPSKKSKQEEQESKLISQAEAAQIRGVSRAAIRDLIRRGRISSISVSGRELVYRDEVLNFESGKPGPAPVNEVTEFYKEHSNIGADFRDFAIQYRTLAEVWGNCVNPSMMLMMLDRKKYRNAGKIYDFIQSVFDDLKPQMSDHDIQMWETNFLNRKSEEFEKQVIAGVITRAQARFFDFLAASGKAEYVVRLAASSAVNSAIWDAAIEDKSKYLDDSYYENVRLDAYKKLANKLRDILGNPFAPGHLEDFHSGKRDF